MITALRMVCLGSLRSVPHGCGMGSVRSRLCCAGMGAARPGSVASRGRSPSMLPGVPAVSRLRWTRVSVRPGWHGCPGDVRSRGVLEGGVMEIGLDGASAPNWLCVLAIACLVVIAVIVAKTGPRG